MIEAVPYPAAGADKIKQAMQVLEEYAIESSISKVAGSETVDYCVDEARADFRRLRLSRGLSRGARLSR